MRRSWQAAVFLGLIGCLALMQREPAHSSDGNVASQNQNREPVSYADAPLRALMMVDQKEGWAVGDDGLIFHTIDGWETYERQTSHVRMSLRSVYFVDAYRGYIVGSEALPFGHGTAGVVLGTTDGGVRWEKLVYKDEIPGLSAVRFVDAETGYAFGDTTGGHASGVFMTGNGGRTWRSIATLSNNQAWTCGTLLADQLVFAGSMGQLGTIEKEVVITLPNRLFPQSYLRGMAASGNDVWLVGSQSSVMVSRQTNGKSWEAISLPMPETLKRFLDFNAVCCQGDHIWIAGRPGSIVLHSWDRGQNWEVQRTGQCLPLHSIHFVSDTQGWAVGELGTILQTTDGGKSWAIRRRGGHRSALLTVTSKLQDLPVGTVAIVGGDQGYLSTALQVNHPPGSAESDTRRLQQAMRLVGGTSAETLTHFPIADYQDHLEANQLAALWGAGKIEAGQALLEEQLVLALRIWRPSVVVCACPSDANSASNVIGAALKRACELASRADVYPDHFTKLDLQPWQSARLFNINSGQTDAVVKYNLDEPKPVLFAAANDFANLARPILLDKFVRGPAYERYTLHESWGDQFDPTTVRLTLFSFGLLTGFPTELLTSNQLDLFSGLTLGYGGQARREKVEVEDFKYALLKQATTKQAIESMSYRMKMTNPAEKKQFFVNFEHSLNGLAPITIGDRIFAQAQEFVEKGQWTMARECHLMLLDLLPTHRLAPESCRFLLTTMGSSELQRRMDLHTMETFAEYPLRMPTLKLTDQDGNIDLDKVLKKQRTALQRRKGEFRQWHKGALAAGEILSVLDPLSYYEPSLQFCLQANLRQEGNLEQSRLWQTSIALKQSTGAWHEAAGAELWLDQRIGSAPKPTFHATRFAEMPKLDGKLDDACWKSAPHYQLQKAAGDVKEATEVMLGYDDQHLYVAVQCQQSKDAPRLTPVKPRQRDEDLRQYDRIGLLLDLDRDYNTYFQFEFDQRGCVAEDCCGDRSWNPKWFIEVLPNKEGWTAEVAIPLIELTGGTKMTDKVWAINVSRIIPGQGIQAVSLPAGVKPKAEGMGLLMFDGDPVKPASFSK